MERKVEEKREVCGNCETRTCKVETHQRDPRSLGEKIDDAAQAFKGDPSQMQKEVKDRVYKDQDRVHKEHREELKDPRDLGQKIGDAKDAFLGKAA